MTIPDQRLRSLTYRSSAVRRFSEFDLSRLLLRAQSFNSSVNVTGLLLSKSGTFLQTIEGPESNIDVVMERICNDLTHGEIDVLADDQIVQRVYPNWTMASNVDVSTSGLLAFLQMVSQRSESAFVLHQRQMIREMIKLLEAVI